MSRPCTICTHGEAARINQRLSAGEGVGAVAAAHGLPATTLYRHVGRCLQLAGYNCQPNPPPKSAATKTAKATVAAIASGSPVIPAVTPSLPHGSNASISLAAPPLPRAAVTREELVALYLELGGRMDAVVRLAEERGALQVAISGLNAIRQAYDSIGRFGGLDTPQTQVNVNVTLSADTIAASLASAFATADDDALKIIEGFVCEPVEAAGSN